MITKMRAVKHFFRNENSATANLWSYQFNFERQSKSTRLKYESSEFQFASESLEWAEASKHLQFRRQFGVFDSESTWRDTGIDYASLGRYEHRNHLPWDAFKSDQNCATSSRCRVQARRHRRGRGHAQREPNSTIVRVLHLGFANQPDGSNNDREGDSSHVLDDEAKSYLLWLGNFWESERCNKQAPCQRHCNLHAYW